MKALLSAALLLAELTGLHAADGIVPSTFCNLRCQAKRNACSHHPCFPS